MRGAAIMLYFSTNCLKYPVSPQKARNSSIFVRRCILATASIFDGAGRIPLMSTIMPRNSWADASKLHLAKFTDKPAFRNFPNTRCIVSRCSSQVVLVMGMSSS